MAFNLTPESLALMMGGLNMMAASRGGNPDLTKGGLGYALQQGLQGGLQGLQMGKQFQQQNQKQKMVDDMLMKLNLDPSAQQSTGVLRPGVQNSALSNLSPEQKEMAKMAIMSGDWKSVMGMMAPGADNKMQFGGQATFKDSKGNLFFGTTRRNPATGQVESVLAPISGGNIQPEGKVEQVGTYGLTAGEQLMTDVERVRQTEQVKAQTQKEWAPVIESAVTEARAMAKERGETFTSLSQAKAALPALTAVVDELRDLAKVATSTIGGKIYDQAVKQTGFGATEGATARAKFIALVNNQVLPLLKPTFGAAFTVQEGEALKATMGDPDATPEEKIAQLDAFIAQKIRDIETKESQLRQMPGNTNMPQGGANVMPIQPMTIGKYQVVAE